MRTVSVYVVTYRRPKLLRRALQSLQSQTFSDWHAFVVNDAPDDSRVASLIDDLKDPQIELYQPIKRRGAAASFNLAFEADCCEFSSLLEDDNWWEPEFLETMIEALRFNPSADVAIGNEVVWRETASDWINTGQSIWPDGDHTSIYFTSALSACGSAKLCNSSMLVRRGGRPAFLTPDDIPVDVTEHFRERQVSQPMVLVHKTLVNYAKTLHTNRSTQEITWPAYQALLIGSCFCSVPPSSRLKLAVNLLLSESERCSPRITALATTGLYFKEARVIWTLLTFRQITRVALSWLRNFALLMQIHRFLGSARAITHLQFLLNSPFNMGLESILFSQDDAPFSQAP